MNRKTTCETLKDTKSTRKRNLSPVAEMIHHSCLKYKKAARKSKSRAAEYRQRLKLALQFDMKLNSKVLDDTAVNFCLSQLRKRNIKTKGRRYTTDEKVLALALYKQSGRAYTKLRQLFALPTRHTIMSMLNKVPLNAGYNKLIFDNLKQAVSKLRNRDKMCSVVFDEMSIMPHLDYDKSNDQFYGFQDLDGNTSDLKIADQVLVFYLCGI